MYDKQDMFDLTSWIIVILILTKIIVIIILAIRVRCYLQTNIIAYSSFSIYRVLFGVVEKLWDVENWLTGLKHDSSKATFKWVAAVGLSHG